MNKIHSFHIPVMGTGFTIDSPLMVAQYGISSVISLVDDTLIEDMRQHYSKQIDEEFVPITKHEEDFRARRITAYLNLLDRIVKRKFEAVKSSCFELGSEITKYFEMLSETSPLKALYRKMLQTTDWDAKKELQEKLRAQMKPGSIDVNIMTKLDRVNFASDKTPLPAEFSDALAALRGYAKSTLESAIVLSAGFNRQLYTYIEKFEDFYADATGFIKKKIILKVSDYRSSLIQGRFLAKKGLWVSEYRVESGLNCGGHAFASDGFLMGPILEEFKTKKDELINGLHEMYTNALAKQSRKTFNVPHKVAFSAQGGIGTTNEDKFLLSHYDLDATGWGSPFLLVPEATSVDEKTLNDLAQAKEDDFYCSDVSPLGVLFNNFKASACDAEKQRRIDNNIPGSACPKGHLEINTEFTEMPICTASRQYQKLKKEQLEKMNLASEAFKEQFEKFTVKACICHQLGDSTLTKHGITKNGINPKRFPAVCPGPNLAYFSRIASLQEMVGHIYGRINLLNDIVRPHMFIKELQMYVEYFKKEIKKSASSIDKKQIQYFNEFKKNLLDGIDYYRELFPKMVEETESYRQKAVEELEQFIEKIEGIAQEYKKIFFPEQSLTSVVA